MKPSHARILDALKRGGSVVRLSRSKRIHVAIWLAYAKYETFTARASTIREMEELNLIRCVDRFTDGDAEWVACESLPVDPKSLMAILT